MSEFVNRRLDANDTELSLKGALQAALDFEGDSSLGLQEVTINKEFRTDTRSLNGENLDEIKNDINTKFPEATTSEAIFRGSYRLSS